MLGYNLVLVALYRGFQLLLKKTIRIGDTNCHIFSVGSISVVFVSHGIGPCL